jgi:hypothetical protein
VAPVRNAPGCDLTVSVKQEWVLDKHVQEHSKLSQNTRKADTSQQQGSLQQNSGLNYLNNQPEEDTGNTSVQNTQLAEELDKVRQQNTQLGCESSRLTKPVGWLKIEVEHIDVTTEGGIEQIRQMLSVLWYRQTAMENYQLLAQREDEGFGFQNAPVRERRAEEKTKLDEELTSIRRRVLSIAELLN